MELLGYCIYITNVPKEIWSVEQITKAYRARWYIEILFKGWKSNLKMKVNIPERYLTPQRAEFFFYASLLMVSCLIMPVFLCATRIAKPENIQLSILKICEFITQQMQMIIRSIQSSTIIDRAIYFGAYEKRRDRINIIDYMFFASS